MGGLCSKKKIADAETENNENEENTDKTPVGERRRKFIIWSLKKMTVFYNYFFISFLMYEKINFIFSNKGSWSFGKD